MVLTTYCTHDDVSSFLAVDGFNTTDGLRVDNLINMNEDEIDRRTLHAFRTITVTNETHNVDSRFRWRFGRAVYLNNRNITSGSTSIQVYDGSTWASWGTEGTDWTVNNDIGVVYVRGFWYWTERDMIMRISYTYGESSVPKDIKKACVLLTAIDIVSNENALFLLPEGGDNVSLMQKADLWQKKADQLISDRCEIKVMLW